MGTRPPSPPPPLPPDDPPGYFLVGGGPAPKKTRDVRSAPPRPIDHPLVSYVAKSGYRFPWEFWTFCWVFLSVLGEGLMIVYGRAR